MVAEQHLRPVFDRHETGLRCWRRHRTSSDHRVTVSMEAEKSLSPRKFRLGFCASVRYGRSNGNRHVHQQTTPAFTLFQTIFSSVHLSAIPLARISLTPKLRIAKATPFSISRRARMSGLGLFGRGGSFGRECRRPVRAIHPAIEHRDTQSAHQLRF